MRRTTMSGLLSLFLQTAAHDPVPGSGIVRAVRAYLPHDGRTRSRPAHADSEALDWSLTWARTFIETIVRRQSSRHHTDYLRVRREPPGTSSTRPADHSLTGYHAALEPAGRFSITEPPFGVGSRAVGKRAIRTYRSIRSDNARSFHSPRPLAIDGSDVIFVRLRRVSPGGPLNLNRSAAQLALPFNPWFAGLCRQADYRQVAIQRGLIRPGWQRVMRHGVQVAVTEVEVVSRLNPSRPCSNVRGPGVNDACWHGQGQHIITQNTRATDEQRIPSLYQRIVPRRVLPAVQPRRTGSAQPSTPARCRRNAGPIPGCPPWPLIR